MKKLLKGLYFVAGIFFLVVGIVKGDTSFYLTAGAFASIGVLEFVVKQDTKE